MVSHCRSLDLFEGRAYHQTECFRAGLDFALNEGIIPAPESTCAIRCAIDEALRCKLEGKAESILFNLSGHGHFDMGANTAFFWQKLEDRDYDEADLTASLDALPGV